MAWSKCGLAALAAAALIALAVMAASSEEKQLSVYAPQTTFMLPVTDRDGREYVDLFAVLEPISKTRLRIEGNNARISGGVAEAQFIQGETSVVTGQRRVRFAPARVIVAEGRVHIPLVALPALLQEIIGLKTELHESARRIFIENTQTRFSIELKKAEETEVVLAFPMRVSPNISQEGNRVRLTFRREPVVMTADSVNFNDPHFSSLHYEEKNGTAEVTVNANAPLLVTFADEGKTLLVKLAPAAVVAQTPAPPSAAPATGVPAAPPAATTAPTTNASPFPFDNVRYFVMIDPGHGGSDPGVKFSDKVIEKDITLALGKRLRAELQNRGVPAVLVRDSDATISNDQRAVAANGQRASLYVSLHAGSMGSGVRVYATVMPKAEPVQGPFVPWNRAQESYRERSNLLARTVASEVNGKKLPARMLNVALPPLHAISAPAIAIEVGPPSAGAPVEELEKAAYQQAVAVAAASAIVNTRNKLEEMR